MKHPFVALIASIFISLPAFAAEPNWIPLFNGRDYTGWKILGPANPAPTVVDHGEMLFHMRRNTAEHTLVTTEKSYGDFILELEFLVSGGTHSGPILRCVEAPAHAQIRLTGYQVKIDPTPRGWTGGIFDDYGSHWRWFQDLSDNPAGRSALKLGEWARLRVEAIGPSLKTWVNGIPTAHLIDEKYTSGPIALKIHSLGDKPDVEKIPLRFRNIRILTENLSANVVETKLPARRALPVADANDGDLTLPDGFRATIVADNLIADGNRPKGDTLRFLTLAPNGDLYAITRKGGIIALRDADRDGRAEIKETFGTEGGTGIVYRPGWLYTTSASAVYRFPMKSGELLPTGPAELIAQLPVQKSHDAKSFAFDADGQLYVNVGSPLNVSAENDRSLGAKGVDPTELQKRQGGIWRFKPDVPNQDQLKDGYRFASGIRHLLSFAWNPHSRAFFAVMMGRDQLNTVAPQFYNAQENAELPAEEMHRLHDQSDLGWPTTYYDPVKKARMLAPEFGGDGKKTAEPGRYPDPVIAFPAHWAPMQMVFNNSLQFPNRYYGGAFVAFHGSWNRGPEPQRGYHVAFVPFGPDGMPSGPYEIFADGFAGRPEIKTPSQARFRPCGVAFGPDGTLYIGETEKGRIWRIVYTGEKPRAKTSAVAPAPIADAARSPPPALSPGAQLYVTHCAACHMPDGSGVSGLQPGLRDNAIVTGDPKLLARVIREGPAAVLPADRPKYANLMPPYGALLKDTDVDALVSYVRETFTSPKQ